MRQGGITAGSTTRLLGIDIHPKLESYSKKRHKKQKENQSLAVITLQAHKEEQAAEFNDTAALMLNSIPKSHMIIMGSDINVAIGSSMTTTPILT